MVTVLLVIHLLIAIGLVGVVLIQRSEGGGLGIGGGSGLMTGRGSANFLTRTTAVLAGLFFMTSIGLAWMYTGSGRPASILDQPAPATAPVAPAPAPAPAEPSVPQR